jgi:hypothetical protein
MITTPDGKTMVVGPDGKPLPNGGKVTPTPTAGQQSVNAQGQNVTMPDGTNPETGEKTQTATAAAPAPAGGQAASPAAGAAKPAYKMDVTTTAYASRLGLLKQNKPDVEAIKKFQKENGLKADGIIGQNTDAAIKKAGAGLQGGSRGAPAQPATGAAPKTGLQTDANQSSAETARLQQLAGAAPKAAPAPGTLGSGTYGITPAPAGAPQAASPAPAGQTSTTTNTSVQGTMKMGKPDGPITFNGKVVKPGEPEYAAASQALIAQQGKIQQVKQGMQPGKPAAAPVQEIIRSLDDSILERIRRFKF